MVVVDTNVLIYAVHSGARQHQSARQWLTESLDQRSVVGMPWQSLLGFIRITTNPRVFSAPLSVEQATETVEAWLGHPSVIVPEPGVRHLSLLTGLLRESGAAGNLTADAHLAALALELGADVVSFDRDFARFGVAVVVPPAR